MLVEFDLRERHRVYPLLGGQERKSYDDPIDSHCYEDIMDRGLRKQVEEGTAGILFDNGRVAFAAFSKDMPTMPYEMMLTCFTHTDGGEVVSTQNSLSKDELSHWYRLVDVIRKALALTAFTRDANVRYQLAIQHVGPNDTLPKIKTNANYRQLHMHIQTITDADYPPNTPFKKVGTDVERSVLNFNSSLAIFRDPLWPVIADITEVVLKNAGIQHEVDNGVVNLGKEIGLDLTPRSLVELIPTVFGEWQSTWRDVADCLVKTDVFWGENLTYPIRSPDERQYRLENLLASEPYVRCLPKTKRALRVLSKRLVEPDFQQYQYLYRGINGALGFCYDFSANSTSLVVSPRVYPTSFKHLPILESLEQKPVVSVKAASDADINAGVASLLVPLHKQVLQVVKQLL